MKIIRQNTNQLLLLLILLSYGVIGFLRLKYLAPGFDETFYAVKSFWVLSGKTGWYSDDVRLWYLPGAYLSPGLAQLLLGPGLLEARISGYLVGFFALTATFLYVQKIADSQSAILAASLLVGSSAILSWPEVSTFALSTLLIMGVLIVGSDKFVTRRLFRVVGLGLLIWILLFTRLNHWISAALLIPIIYLSTEDRSLKDLAYVVLLVVALSLVTLILLPNNFSQQVASLGVLPLIYKVLPFLPQPETLAAIPSDALIAGASAPRSVSSALNIPTVDPHSAFAPVKAFFLRLPEAALSIVQNLGVFSSNLLLILLGVMSFFFARNPANHRPFLSSLGLAFLISMGLSFLYGYPICKTCGVNYTNYFLGPGAIVAGIGFAQLSHRFRVAERATVIFSAAVVGLGFFHLHHAIKNDPYTATFKSDISQLALQITDQVPAGEDVLPVGFLDKQPILWGIFHAEKFFPAPLLNHAFSFRATNLDVEIPAPGLADLFKNGYWSHHHYVKWIKDEYDYILKPAHLYFDDHPYKYWFRNVYYPVALRELISEHFDCIRMPGTYHEISELELCSRKTAIERSDAQN